MIVNNGPSKSRRDPTAVWEPFPQPAAFPDKITWKPHKCMKRSHEPRALRRSGNLEPFWV
jgi:hypothetical protein